jgi:hypothetical protein
MNEKTKGYSDMKQKQFSLENVLAVAFDRRLSANKDGVLELCSFLVGKEITPDQVPMIVQSYCQPAILEQHPELTVIDIALVTDANYWPWLVEQRQKYGAYITFISPTPPLPASVSI